jgi:hypothetical protein
MFDSGSSVHPPADSSSTAATGNPHEVQRVRLLLVGVAFAAALTGCQHTGSVAPNQDHPGPPVSPNGTVRPTVSPSVTNSPQQQYG